MNNSPPPGSVFSAYFDTVHALLRKAEQTQGAAIQAAARQIAGCLMQGGMLHVFGTGHSHILAEEVFFRAGGLVQVNAILDPGLMLHLSALGSTELERLPNYASIVLARYDLRPGDVLLVISNSGRNAVPIEAAMIGREKGLQVIALTSAQAYRNLASRHPSGKRLSEAADLVIDTCVPEGDAAISIPGLAERVGPVSTILGAALLQALICEVIREMVAHDFPPKILISANIDDQQVHTDLYGEYLERIRHY